MTEQNPIVLPVHRSIGDESGPFGRLWDLTLVGDAVVVLEWQPLQDRGQIQVVDGESGKIIGSSGAPGQGPGELVRPQSIQPIPGTTRFWINDYHNGRMVLYDIDQLSDPVEYVELRGSPYQAYWDNRGLLYMNGLFATELIRRYRRDGSLTHVDGEIGRPLVANAPPEKLQHLNRNMLALHPSEDRLAVGFTFLDRFHIYDHRGTLLKAVELPGADQVEPAALLPVDGRWQSQIREVRATEGAIVILAYEPTEGDGSQLQPTALWVYTWDGELRGTSRLEEPLARFAVDPGTGIIWGIRYDAAALVEFAPLHPSLGSSLRARNQ